MMSLSQNNLHHLDENSQKWIARARQFFSDKPKVLSLVFWLRLYEMGNPTLKISYQYLADGVSFDGLPLDPPCATSISLAANQPLSLHNFDAVSRLLKDSEHTNPSMPLFRGLDFLSIPHHPLYSSFTVRADEAVQFFLDHWIEPGDLPDHRNAFARLQLSTIVLPFFDNNSHPRSKKSTPL
jgi:hypothetical protein